MTALYIAAYVLICLLIFKIRMHIALKQYKEKRMWWVFFEDFVRREIDESTIVGFFILSFIPIFYITLFIGYVIIRIFVCITNLGTRKYINEIKDISKDHEFQDKLAYRVETLSTHAHLFKGEERKKIPKNVADYITSEYFDEDLKSGMYKEYLS